VVEAVGGDWEELVGLLRPWRDAVIAGGGYPGRAFVTETAARKSRPGR
jgi:hypothetical protein